MGNAKLGGGLGLVVALFMAGCGGGGGSDGNAPGTAPGTGAVAAQGTLVTSVPTATYPAGLAAEYFTTLNDARAKAGAGLVAQNSLMDTAATAHATYVTAHGLGNTPHEESPSQSDFYATTVDARLKKAGFMPGTFTEIIGGPGPSGLGRDCAYGLLDSVYHGAAALSASTHIGFGHGTDGLGVPMCVVNLATKAEETHVQVPPAGAMVTYPYAGQTQVLEVFYVGYESPRPSVTLFPNLTAGTPVLVSLRNADYVNARTAGTLNPVITQFELKDAGGNVVPSAILANSNLTGSGVTLHSDSNLGDGFAVLVPFAPLATGATYTVNFTATVRSGGAAIHKSWSFTTGG